VDYLQLMKPTEGDTRAQQVGAIAWGLKQLAMQLGCPVMLLSQLNRAGVRNADDTNPPNLYALKESGDVENHSNAVILLHRPQEGFSPDGSIPIWAKIAKARPILHGRELRRDHSSIPPYHDTL
jgi:replicative DNA helicase